MKFSNKPIEVIFSWVPFLQKWKTLLKTSKTKVEKIIMPPLHWMHDFVSNVNMPGPKLFDLWQGYWWLVLCG